MVALGYTWTIPASAAVSSARTALRLERVAALLAAVDADDDPGDHVFLASVGVRDVMATLTTPSRWVANRS